MITKNAPTLESLPDGKKISRYRAVFPANELEFVPFFGSFAYKVALVDFPTNVDKCTDFRLCVSGNKSYTSLDIINGYGTMNNIAEINSVINEGNLLIIPVWNPNVTPSAEDLMVEGQEFVLTFEYTTI